MANNVQTLFNDLIAKIETVSEGYAAKHDIRRDADWFMLKLQEEVGELTQAFLKATGRARSKNATTEHLKQKMAEEAADVLCHLLLFARHHDMDLLKAVQEKWLAWLPEGRGNDEA